MERCSGESGRCMRLRLRDGDGPADSRGNEQRWPDVIRLRSGINSMKNGTMDRQRILSGLSRRDGARQAVNQLDGLVSSSKPNHHWTKAQ
ncbi:hypothetical protein GGTG_06077 [Gaeumannomyces tritici R3-111a-1]|uniref:Uncharacterized protein n=1 Tax=Gaeumannomyces tritici (strain R3-111a-1) TaxID=644352 RepID=J3NXS2_GAET3|nr:hypothetical protein GGTG_06077 [Gaeumannomyces tritici R3-111a-1]EJT76155.1 hypothetical protein GGTG_06077 [Gaeumannomyces tritici R3-111a-1]